jgi:hypothetical protein
MIKHYTDIAITGQQKVNDVNEGLHDGSPNSDTLQETTKSGSDIIENTVTWDIQYTIQSDF